MPAGNMATREGFTELEDKEIIKYILENNKHLKVKGAKLWRNLSVTFYEKCGTHRTWQSLKERYIKRIIPRLSDFKLDPESMKKLLLLFPKTKNAEVKEKYKNRYKSDDDQVIFQWVLNHPTKYVKGNILWQELESCNVLKGRTWASLKERFLKYLVDRAKDVLKPEDADKISRIVQGDVSIVRPYFRTKVSCNRWEVPHHLKKTSAPQATSSFSNSTVNVTSSSKLKGPDTNVSNNNACAVDSNSESDDSKPLQRYRKKRRTAEIDGEDKGHCKKPVTKAEPSRLQPKKLAANENERKKNTPSTSKGAHKNVPNKTGRAVDSNSKSDDSKPLQRYRKKRRTAEKDGEDNSLHRHCKKPVTKAEPSRLQPKKLSVNENELKKIKVESGHDQPEDGVGMNGEGESMILFLSDDDTHVDPLTDTLFVHGVVEVNGKMVCLGVPNFPVLHPIF